MFVGFIFFSFFHLGVSFKVWEDCSHHPIRNVKYSLQIILKIGTKFPIFSNLLDPIYEHIKIMGGLPAWDFWAGYK